MYELGDGVEKNYEEAIKWYTKAAKQDIPQSQQSLGFMYKFGWGVEKDIETGHKYLELGRINCSESYGC